MYIKILAIVMISLICGPVVASEKGGRISVKGEIVESACTIATDDIWQEVDFGNVNIRDINRQRFIPQQKFTLHLINCRLDKNSGEVWTSALVTFSGPNEESNPGLFSMTGEGDGLSLRIIDDNGVIATSGVALPPLSLSENATDVNFKLHLIDSGKSLGVGNLSTSLRFMIDWQ